MATFWPSFLLVLISEMGDKTQLLALVLAARFRRPWVVLGGVFVSTLLNHALASWLGGRLAASVDASLLRWILSGAFFAFAVWVLIPDKDSGGGEKAGAFGAFLSTAVSFFLAEMGDKTQLATIALGAKFDDVPAVAVATTLGMLAANGPVIFLGDRFTARLPLRWIRVGASLLFAAYGAALAAGVGVGIGQ